MTAKKQSRNLIPITYDLSDVFNILRAANNKRFLEAKKVRPTFIDSFLYSGRFNSVLGLDGFQNFKEELKGVIEKVNADDFGANYINLDSMYEVLLRSGVYYVEAHLPEELKELATNTRWLTAYRYVARNFPNVDYKEFREIVKRFKDSNGHSFYITPEDTKGLLSITSHIELFTESIDVKGALLQLSQKDLKTICEKIGAKPARSIEETVNRILESAGQTAFEHLSEESKRQKTLVIRDDELAAGADIIALDQYLRTIAKVTREDLVNFIDKQRCPAIGA